MLTRAIQLAVLALVMSGCVNHEPPSFRVNQKFVDSPQVLTPKKVLLLEVDVIIKEVTVGGVAEEVPAWSKQGTANVQSSLLKYFQNRKENKLQLVEVPSLTEREQEDIKQHLALYRRVEGTISDYAYSPMFWPHKITKFDYTLGPGLKILADKTGADSALIVFGHDRASTAGRKVAAFFLDSVSYGYSHLSAGFINLKSGDVLWYNTAFEYKGMDLREQDDAYTLVTRLFTEYPGIERYKDIRLAQP